MNNNVMKVLLGGAIAAFTVSAQATQMKSFDVYGTVHSSFDRQVSDGTTSFEVDSSARRGWALGARGGVVADPNMLAIFRFELGYDGSKDMGIGAVDTNSDNAADTITGSTPGNFYLRDSWVGLKGGFGKVRMGTMATYYKKTGADIDPLFTTALEGRDSKLAMMSSLHAGNGIGAGRGSQMISYDSPTIAGIFRFNAHLQPRDGDKWNYGGGAKLQFGPATVFGALTTDANGDMAMKGGAKAVFGPAVLGAQYERGDALNGQQFGFISASFKVTSQVEIAMNYGIELDKSDMGISGGANYRLAKKSKLYLGYGRNFPGSSSVTKDYSVMTVGLKHQF